MREGRYVMQIGRKARSAHFARRSGSRRCSAGLARNMLTFVEQPSRPVRRKRSEGLCWSIRSVMPVMRLSRRRGLVLGSRRLDLRLTLDRSRRAYYVHPASVIRRSEEFRKREHPAARLQVCALSRLCAWARTMIIEPRRLLPGSHSPRSCRNTLFLRIPRPNLGAVSRPVAANPICSGMRERGCGSTLA